MSKETKRKTAGAEWIQSQAHRGSQDAAGNAAIWTGGQNAAYPTPAKILVSK